MGCVFQVWGFSSENVNKPERCLARNVGTTLSFEPPKFIIPLTTSEWPNTSTRSDVNPGGWRTESNFSNMCSLISFVHFFCLFVAFSSHALVLFMRVRVPKRVQTFSLSFLWKRCSDPRLFSVLISTFNFSFCVQLTFCFLSSCLLASLPSQTPIVNEITPACFKRTTLNDSALLTVLGSQRGSSSRPCLRWS